MVGISLKLLLICYLIKSVYSQKQRKECYVPARGAVQTVANGEPVMDRYYPWHVSIFKIKSGLTAYICGGSIISHDFIISAAHCFYEDGQVIIDDRLFIRAGSNKRERGDYYGINKKIIHRDFTPGNSRADIALLQTLNVIPFTRSVRPVCYTKTDFVYVNKDAWIPGWGLTENQTDGLSENLNHVNMPGRTRDDCEELNPDFYSDHVTDNSFCAGNLNTTSICTGDSGGGLVMPLSDGWYIRGIASTAPAASFGTPGICDLTKFVLFTDVVSYADWIDDNLSSKNRKSGKRKSEEACDQYIQNASLVTLDEFVNSNSSFRKVESAKEFPNYCALLRQYTVAADLIGSGSLISNRWVITAGICKNKETPTFVLLGAYNLNYSDPNETGHLIAIQEIINHPLNICGYNRGNHNIALVKMEQAVKFSAEIHPACLYTDNNGPAVGTELMLASFEKIQHNNDRAPKVLQQKNQKVNPCYYKYFSYFEFEVIPNHICLLGVTTGTCFGEHGAPLQLLINAEKRIFSVVAITPQSGGCSTNDEPALSTRVSYYLDWIEGHVWLSE